MGFSLGWLATRGVQVDGLYSLLQAKSTGVRKPVLDAPAMAGSIGNGWHLTVINRDQRLVDDAFLKAASLGGVALGCFVEEHVMYSHATVWRDGSKEWSLVHESEKGALHLEVEGTPPPSFAKLRAEREGAQRNEEVGELAVDHIFDIPIAVAEAETGFRHDSEKHVLELEVLEVVRRAWWKRALGLN